MKERKMYVKKTEKNCNKITSQKFEKKRQVKSEIKI